MSSLYFQLICSFSPNIKTVPTPSLQCPKWHQPNPDTPQACGLLRPGTRLYGPVHPRNVAEVPASGNHFAKSARLLQLSCQKESDLGWGSPPGKPMPSLVTFNLTPQTLWGLFLAIRDTWVFNELSHVVSLRVPPLLWLNKKVFLFVFDKKKNVKFTENYMQRKAIQNDLYSMN